MVAAFFGAAFFFAAFFVAALVVGFFGTFLPARRDSDSAIAIACLRLVTFFLLLPDLSVPFFRFFMTLRTLSDALSEYFRAMWSPCRFVPGPFYLQQTDSRSRGVRIAGHAQKEWTRADDRGKKR